MSGTAAYADPTRDAAALFPLMRELRPHLASTAEFAARWQRQAAEGYRIAALWPEERPVALAGFRLQDNLMHGRHLYVDDLVTAEGERAFCAGTDLAARLHVRAPPCRSATEVKPRAAPCPSVAS